MLTEVINIQEALINDGFIDYTVERGYSYYKNGKVFDLHISKNNKKITAKVIGAQHKIYDTSIIIEFQDNHEYFYDDYHLSESLFDGYCSCPMQFKCKHVVATILTAHHETNTKKISKTENNCMISKPTPSNTIDCINSWFNPLTLSCNNQKESVVTDKLRYSIIYQIDIIPDTISLKLTIKIINGLQAETNITPKTYQANIHNNSKYVSTIDKPILNSLDFLGKHQVNNKETTYLFSSNDPTCNDLLEKIIKTKRCFMQDTYPNPTKLGEARNLNFKWELLPNTNQKLKTMIDNIPTPIFDLSELWYLDLNNNTIGKAKTTIPYNTAYNLLIAPEIPPSKILETSKQLRTILPQNTELLPIELSYSKLKKNIKPIPEIILDLAEVEYNIINIYSPHIATAQIYFNYNDIKIPVNPNGKSDPIFTYIENNIVHCIKRNITQEKKHLKFLQEHILLLENKDFFNHEMPKIDLSEKFILPTLDSPEDFFNFSLNIPELEKKDWLVIKNHEAYLEIIPDIDVNWYSELDDHSEYDYFGFNIGIMIDNEKINILPLITKLLREKNISDFSDMPDDYELPLVLPDSRVLAVPYSRIKPILGILIELYGYNSNSNLDNLRIAKQQASLLYEIEKAFNAATLRWFGGVKLRKLATKLSEFKSINEVLPPKTFKANLRPYQQEGVNWLQFLREYQLSGILADDMGLGKTVQTLAHLSIEKNRGRMQKPSLLIAPTSLMVNWKFEITKFIPNLKTLVYHGDNRKLFDNLINDYNLVITTYPLLIRDKELLLNHDFYYLILDEAQFIKNNKAKSTQIVHQIKSEHRLCLTGTPMENHLGELWSLFHFLMPGFLGNVQQFNKLFRTPIEKHNDNDRRKSLAHRLKPFMLRRNKNEVAKELPEKTEIIQKVELSGPQRDLYESIRLSMEKKVRDAIKKQGLSRSHIVILDALLKLRQVCCDPKLLKLTSAKKAHKHSAKMDCLMSMLPEMVEEGRKILIFSQFTSMLSIIETALQKDKLEYVKLTGSTRNRIKPIGRFQNGDVPIFLISLKAGGTGLNLTAADTVIHYDPWWNPATENQATDRAHRIGQKKSVFIYKLQASSTVEETIHEMQQKKKKIIQGLFASNNAGKLELSSTDLSNLFKPL